MALIERAKASAHIPETSSRTGSLHVQELAQLRRDIKLDGDTARSAASSASRRPPVMANDMRRLGFTRYRRTLRRRQRRSSIAALPLDPAGRERLEERAGGLRPPTCTAARGARAEAGLAPGAQADPLDREGIGRLIRDIQNTGVQADDMAGCRDRSALLAGMTLRLGGAKTGPEERVSSRRGRPVSKVAFGLRRSARMRAPSWRSRSKRQIPPAASLPRFGRWRAGRLDVEWRRGRASANELRVPAKACPGPCPADT